MWYGSVHSPQISAVLSSSQMVVCALFNRAVSIFVSHFDIGLFDLLFPETLGKTKSIFRSFTCFSLLNFLLFVNLEGFVRIV
jgi:hypothetical protein